MKLRLRVLLACVLLAGCGAPGAPPRPDVIVVVIDTLRPDALDLYGAERETAPYLARLGAESAVFLGAFGGSTWTAPSTASLFTGLYPLRHGVTLGFHAHQRAVEEIGERGTAPISMNRLPDAEPTLPEQFAGLGYRTFGLASNVNIGSEIGFDRGFDHFVHVNNASAEALEARIEELGPELDAARPFFLYLHLNDVHAPYEPRAPWYQQQERERDDLRAAYESEIRYVDTVLGRIVERVDPGGEALLAVVSDHGEEFWEHGHGKHTHSLHYELARILFLLRAPSLGVLPARVSENVSIVDLLPTLLDLLEAPSPADLDGVSLAPLLRGGFAGAAQRRALAGRPVIHHRRSHIHDYELSGVVKGRWHLIDDGRKPRLYDLGRDPLEQRNLAGAHPEVVEVLRADFAAARPAEPAPATPVEVPLDREGLEQLRALGYVEE